MKNNTFIIPAFSFYVLKEPKGAVYDTSNNLDVSRLFQNQIDRGECSYVSFDEVDGLTVSEMADSLKIKKFFAISAGVKTHHYDIGNTNNRIYTNMDFFNTVLFSIDSDKIDMEISSVFHQYIESAYSTMNDRQKRICHSFLEQYRCNGYEETKKMIKRIEQERK